MKTRISVSDQMVDITNPIHEVEVTLTDGKLWVNVDGICRLRVLGIPKNILALNYRAKDWTCDV